MSERNELVTWLLRRFQSSSGPVGGGRCHLDPGDPWSLHLDGVLDTHRLADDLLAWGLEHYRLIVLREELEQAERVFGELPVGRKKQRACDLVTYLCDRVAELEGQKQ